MSVGLPVGTRKGTPQTLEVGVLPAPIGGIDGSLNFASNNPMNCVYAYNILPSEFGLRTRLGWREYVTGCEFTPSAGLGVRSLIPYTGTGAFGDRLFAVTNEGIWDATSPTQTPTRVFTFPSIISRAGFGTFAHYTTAAGAELLLFADEENGLHQYDPPTNTWTLATGITGVPIIDIVFVVVHKLRIWFIERDTTSAYYLPVASISGAATEFTFGSKFRHGGDLVGLYNWTIDGGDGVDDYLVAVSRSGDVIPFQGEDPSAAATWRSVGTFFVGEMAVGRRCGGENGGDLFLVCEFGLVTLSELLRGNIVTPQRGTMNGKIARFLRADFLDFKADEGWEFRVNPIEGSIIITTPQRLNGEFIQYVYNLAVEGWGQWRGVPSLTMETWTGAMMIGTADGRVLRMDVSVDNSNFDDTVGAPVEFSMLQNFLDGGAPGIFKYPKFTRPNFLSAQPVGVTTKFLYDYDINTLLAAALTPQPDSANVWDTGTWDDAVWQTAALGNQTVTRGAVGAGRTVAVAMRGLARTRTTLLSTDVMYIRAGPF
jgi:hypothetical protein